MTASLVKLCATACRRGLTSVRSLRGIHVPSSAVDERTDGVGGSDDGGDGAPQPSVPHLPVMVNEVIEHLNLKPGDVFIDMTFGAGGHSLALLERIPDLKVLALDRDPTTAKYVEEARAKYPNQIVHLLGKFSDLSELMRENGYGENSVDGILFDLGCSSMQFDNGERGFSIARNGPLDMRMDCDRVPNSVTAADVIAYATEKDLADIFKIYGEERRAKKIAKAIHDSRFTFKPLTTTQELNDLVQAVCSDVRRDKLSRKAHTATKIFQALRIFVNNELNELNYGLMLAHSHLKPNGRAVALTFHSLEDKIVKRTFTNQAFANFNDPPPLISVSHGKIYTEDELVVANKKNWVVINRKVIVPSEEEVLNNARSRSAKLRAAAKV